jgi:hypothetical protein
MQKFNHIFKEELIKEIPVVDIGIFPGKFKPPHKGHFKTAKVANSQNKIVFILISEKEHEGITADISLEIWGIYKKYLPNIEPYIVTVTPVLATLELLNVLNNGGNYVGLPTAPSPKTNIQDIIQSSSMLGTYLNKGNNFKTNLYSSPEDAQRYKHSQKEPYIGKNIVSADFKKVDRSTSATLFRQSLKNQNNFEIERFLPEELSPEDKKTIINILRKNVNV